MPRDLTDPGYAIRVGDVIAFDVAFQALDDDTLLVRCYSDGTPIEREPVIRKRDALWPSCLPALVVALPGQPPRPVAWSPETGQARRQEATAVSDWQPPRRPEPGECPLCADTGEQWPNPDRMDGTADRDEPRPCPRGPH